MTLHGAALGIVRRALERGDPLPGGAGFAGAVDGTLVRDVLGRYPLFLDAETGNWATDPTALSAPRRFPPGHALDGVDASPVLDGASDQPAGSESERTDESVPENARTAEPRRVWTLPDPDPFESERRAVDELREAIATGLEETVPQGAAVAVAFSGGVDSTVVASGVDGPLYVGGFPDSHDVEAARSTVRGLDRDLRVVEFSVDDLERAVPEVARVIGRADAMAVQIALPLYLVARRASEDGYDHLAVGQGADELFGGYAKVARAPADPRVEADTVRGARRELVRTLPNQLERDVLALRAAGVEPVAPLLHDRVVETALRLPGEALVDERGERKRTFRLAARAFVPDRVAFREKKAVQYGSLVGRELDRLAREAGFKRRMDDHVTKYVASRVDADALRIEAALGHPDADS